MSRCRASWCVSSFGVRPPSPSAPPGAHGQPELGIYHVQCAWPIFEFQNSDSITQNRSNLLSSNLLFRQRRIVWVTSMCFDGGALSRAQYARANFRISPELFIFFGARSFIADKGVVLVINHSAKCILSCERLQLLFAPLLLPYIRLTLALIGAV